MENVSDDKKLFVERWGKVLEKRGLALKSTASLAREIGIKDDTFRRYTDPMNATKPTMEALRKMAIYCNVSADYLLGITDVMSADMKMREFCNQTGLSEAAVGNLINMKQDKTGYPEIVSGLIENPGFFNVITTVGEVIRKQSAQLSNNLPKDKKLNKDDVTVQYCKLINKNTPIIDYEAQYDISKGTISSFEDVVMDKVCDKVYKSVR